MNHPTPMETEVKVRVESLEEIASRLEAQGFRLEMPAQLERSVLWDRGRELYEQGCALRVRRYGSSATLTWKGPKMEDALLKIRPELETSLGEAGIMERILEALGYTPVLTMEKTRALWRRPDLLACLDQTPFGAFLELEGQAEAIHAAMDALGLDPARVETRSYPTLFREAGLA